MLVPNIISLEAQYVSRFTFLVSTCHPGGHYRVYYPGALSLCQDFAVAHDLVIGNTLFKKRNSHLITYASGDHETQVDYILFRRGLRKHIRDVKVIPEEECLTQHRLLVCIFKIAAVPRVKRKFTPQLLCCRIWGQVRGEVF